MNRRNSDRARALRAELAARLRAESPQIHRAIFSRVQEISDPSGEPDPTYLVGLDAAVADAVAYTIEAIEQGPEPPPRLPLVAIAHTRRAAREGVRLDTVLRRYGAGSKIIEDFLIEAASDLSDILLRQVLNEHGHRVERVMEAASGAYDDELSLGRRSAGRRQGERVASLLASDARVAPPDLEYDFDSWHVGIILWGRDAAPAARLLAERLGYRSLHAERDPELVWTWLGSRKQPAIADFVRSAREETPAGTFLTVGEPRRGLEGWRLTHREARTALRVMWKGPNKVTRGRDVVLASAVLSDEAFVRSLLDTYLAPLETNGHRAGVLTDTLRAFFSTGWNAAAAAEALGVDRHTVRERVRRVEKILGQPLSTCSAELQVALQIADLKDRSMVLAL